MIILAEGLKSKLKQLRTNNEKSVYTFWVKKLNDQRRKRLRGWKERKRVETVKEEGHFLIYFLIKAKL